MKYIAMEEQNDLMYALNSTFRYLDDLLNIDK